MKKHLIAAAVAGAFAVPAMAQVTVAGQVDIGYVMQEDSNRAGTNKLKSAGVGDGAHAGSRIIFRGEEDLGGGMKALFHLEYGMSPTSAAGLGTRTSSANHQLGNAPAASTGVGAVGGQTLRPDQTVGSSGQSGSSLARQTFAGISGGFGAVTIGYQYHNAYALASLSGYANAETQGANYQNATGNFGGRANMIQYASPTVQGFKATLQRGQGAGRETAEATVNGAVTGRDNTSFMSLRVDYAAGPLSAGVAITEADFQSNTALGAGVPGTLNTAKRSADQTQVAVSYNLGVARIAATWASFEDGGAVNNVNSTEIEAQQVTVTVPLGALSVWASTGSAEGTRTGTGKTTDSSGSAFGARYALSKRTTLYALTGSEKNKPVNATAFTTYKSERTIVGVHHSF
jgi:predicted porin